MARKASVDPGSGSRPGPAQRHGRPSHRRRRGRRSRSARGPSPAPSAPRPRSPRTRIRLDRAPRSASTLPGGDSARHRRVDVFDEEVLDVGLERGQPPGDPVVVPDQHGGNAGQRRAGRPQAGSVEGGEIPDGRRSQPEMRIVGEDRFAARRSGSRRGPRSCCRDSRRLRFRAPRAARRPGRRGPSPGPATGTGGFFAEAPGAGQSVGGQDRRLGARARQELGGALRARRPRRSGRGGSRRARCRRDPTPSSFPRRACRPASRARA